MTTETKTLIQKLGNVQRQLKAPKSRYSKYGDFHYRSLEDIFDAVKPLNAEEGIVLTITDEPVFIGDWHYIKATATVTDGNDSISVSAYARETPERKKMDDSQLTGASSSYARKYALNGLYLIDDVKDPDTPEYTEQGQDAPKDKPKPLASKQDVDALYDAVVDFIAVMANMGQDLTEEQVLGKFNITDPAQTPKDLVKRATLVVIKWKDDAQANQGGEKND